MGRKSMDYPKNEGATFVSLAQDVPIACAAAELLQRAIFALSWDEVPRQSTVAARSPHVKTTIEAPLCKI
jgi:hypothetical protein